MTSEHADNWDPRTRTNENTVYLKSCEIVLFENV